MRFQEFKARFDLKKVNNNLQETKGDLEEAYDKLKELDETKDRFFANISHELRTPITLILAPTDMMLKRDLGDLTPPQEKYLKIMHGNALRLLRLINNMLDLSKADAGKMTLFYNCSNFVEFANGVVSSISPLAEEKSLALRFEGHEPISDFYFDQDKIEKVILNLVSNAIKFTESGEIKVACESKGDHVLVAVSDRGIGIPKEHMPHMFARFSQADDSMSRNRGGTGIGLALAKELIDLHHGEIWVESEEGKGTTFFFTLPIITQLEDVSGALDRRVVLSDVQDKRREEDWSNIAVAESDTTDAGALPEDSIPLRVPSGGKQHLRILLIDDNAEILRYVASQLEDDYELLFAKDGREGLERAKSEIPDLIISDVMMPHKDGYQLCREVKQDHQTCHIPVVLLTAKTDLSTKIEGLEHGADDYLTKPFNPRELKARVRSLLNLRKLEREIQTRRRELEEAMAALKETQGQLVQSEKMAALGLLVAGVAHEINNPVSFAKGSLTTIQRCLDRMKKINEMPPEEAAEIYRDVGVSVDIIKHGLERTENIVRNLKTFVRKDESFMKGIDLEAALETTLQLCQHEMTHKIRLHREYGKVCLIEAIPGQLNQVFMNLIQNAVHAIPERGDIYIKTEQRGEDVIVSIRDTGTGISEKDLAHIYDPFFTTKETGKGTGLGMTISHKIIERHHGKIKVNSKVGHGTEVSIILPISQPILNKPLEGKHYAGNVSI